MNYIKEMNAFYDWLETNELSPSAINLWYALMHINNKAGWAETFVVAESVLCVKTGLTDRTLRKVRNELKQKGRIDFTSRKGGKAPIYKVNSFYSSEINSADSAEGSAGGSSGGSAGDSSALIKLNESKRNETNNLAGSDVYRLVEEYFISISKKEEAFLESYLDDLGEELVIEAMRRARVEGKKFSYAAGIMKDWFNKKVRTIDDVQRQDNQFEQYKQRKQQKIATGGTRYGNTWE